ncbi:helix-turn-helix domain-containing protein [Acidomonas methanolica]|uniref:helix-turn-helix domain-containing protein n=1 Tax=Acidomonas methanolica TaxID=437 RepID=UPI002119E3E7|nr:helix-turn-helix domain-containing protein [Acidomonas methanolica]MCQ9156833.1 helix-turn-helix domain-containing protein [Acidomonas methanolica]
MSDREIAEARRQARKLRPLVAGRLPNARVAVQVGALQSIIRLVEIVSDQAQAGEVEAPRRPGVSDEISPQQAAELLGMSRPSVMRLIEKGALHPRKVLSRNKLSRAEIMAYRERQTKGQREALDNLAALTETYDF